MYTCQECNEDFENEDEAKAHITETHATECDKALQQYIADAEQDVLSNLILVTDE